MSVYNPENYTERVNYSVQVARRKGNATRTLEACGMMNDGPLVIVAAYRRMLKTDQLDLFFALFCKSYTMGMVEKYKNVPDSKLTEYAKIMREEGSDRLDEVIKIHDKPKEKKLMIKLCPKSEFFYQFHVTLRKGCDSAAASLMWSLLHVEGAAPAAYIAQLWERIKSDKPADTDQLSATIKDFSECFSHPDHPLQIVISKAMGMLSDEEYRELAIGIQTRS